MTTPSSGNAYIYRAHSLEATSSKQDLAEMA